MEFFVFLLTIFCAFVGATIATKLKLPAGALVGAISAVVALNLFYGQSVFYTDFRVILQIFSGVMIGGKIGKKDLAELKTIIFPTVILILGMVMLNLTFGGLIYKYSSLDVATALFATAPGGVADMALISSELGANTGYVGILQLFRILTVFIFMPSLFKAILSKDKIKHPERYANVSTNEEVSAANKEKFPLKRFLFMLLIAAVGGLICKTIGIAAGALTGSMVFSAAFAIWKGTVNFPSAGKKMLQVFSGAYIGISVDKECIQTMPQLIVPLLIMFVGIFAFVFFISTIMNKVCKTDLAVCLLSSTPGGLQEMALLSEELHADTPKVAVMQSFRLMSVVIFFPTMLKAITEFFT